MHWAAGLIFAGVVNVILISVFDVGLGKLGIIVVGAIGIVIGSFLSKFLFGHSKKAITILATYSIIIRNMITVCERSKTITNSDFIEKLESEDLDDTLVGIEGLGWLRSESDSDRLQDLIEKPEISLYVKRNLGMLAHEKQILSLGEDLIKTKDSIEKLFVLLTLLRINSPISYKAISQIRKDNLVSKCTLNRIAKYFVTHINVADGNLLGDFCIFCAQNNRKASETVISALPPEAASQAEEEFISQLNTKDSWNREDAAICLSMMQTEKAYSALLAVLETEDEPANNVQFANMESLHKGRYQKLRHTVAKVIGNTKHPDVVAKLTEYMDYDDLDLAFSSSLGLLEVDSNKSLINLAINKYLKIWKRLKNEQKIEFLLSLGDAKNEEAYDLLTEVLKDDRVNWNVRGAAAIGLGKSGNADSIPVLTDSFQKYKKIKSEITEGLILLDHKAVYDDFNSLLKNISAGQTRILDAIMKSAGERAIDLLHNILSSLRYEENAMLANEVNPQIALIKNKIINLLCELNATSKLKYMIHLLLDDQHIDKFICLQAVDTLYVNLMKDKYFKVDI
jgi:HEAT repeat protein